MKKATNKNPSENPKEIRIKDKRSHFLGKELDGEVYIYCKKCKEFHKVSREERGEKTDS